MATEHQPSSTRLYSVPVTVSGEPWTCLMYTNDLAVSNPTQPALMIVPFPNPHNATEFGLVDMRHTRTFRKQVTRAFAAHEHRITTNATYGAKSLGVVQEMAAVVEIGNYKCSVVPNVEALFSKVQWHRFHTPSDIALRLAVLRDSTVIPPHCGFVVAEAVRSVQDDGFGIVYPGKDVFFPTCHEGGPPTHLFDVCCYAANSAFSPDLPSTLLPCSSAPGTGYTGLDGAMLTLPRSMKSSRDEHEMWFEPVARVTHFAFTQLYGSGPNRNVTGTLLALPDDPLAPRTLLPAVKIVDVPATPAPSAWFQPTGDFTSVPSHVGVPPTISAGPSSRAWCTRAEAQEIIRLGRVYAKGRDRYHIGLEEGIVRCDYCNANVTDLPVLGYLQKDLCLRCRDQICQGAWW
jgi:hypothetical protein